MHPPVSASHKTNPKSEVAPADNSCVDRNWPTNMHLVETAPNARPAVAAVFQMILLFIIKGFYTIINANIT